ncbi:hypothetical protein CJD36_019625 [Flavipsychrobacter stenotrophus]|uniref:Secretion system C-terminal sorting domain-containing protein n=1 Tax=Flavipsychrobacter stenotrophus TaxID=2077091 RepID=A0A2S7SRB7_9BACT|nr:T9SS type A sorting domain-containing protein [Flavipsychrobacter stenotrophus]PQJ09453.1 hypothetical protein CJD36_019625 [Flavipsychrobacter stenotrophus]
MKKFLLASSLLLSCIGTSMAYTTNVIQDSIATDTHWTCDQQYLLKGYVYVTAGHTLTIDSGVIIKGDKITKGALIIERGAKIMAMGTLMHPIVFTSNQAPGNRSYGDWGGVIVCGQAPVNWTAGQAQVEGGPRSFYGGVNPNDNSGVMTYCRIEFGGIAFSPNNEVNGLTFCGVGNATVVNHIQVSYSGDDSYEFFGGTVNTKNMVAFGTWDDDYDTDNGYAGMNQFIVAVRDAGAADQSGSKAFESDSYLSGTVSGLAGDTTKVNRSIFCNATLVGPLNSPAFTGADPNYVAGVHLRRGSAMSVLNSLILGWPCAVLVDESSSSYGSTVANIGNGILQFRNNIIAGTANTSFNKDVVFVKDGARSLTPTTANSDTTATGTDWSVLAGGVNLGPITWFKNPAYKNKSYSTVSGGVQLGNPFNLANPVLVPNSTSPIVYSSVHYPSWATGVNDVFDPTMPLNYDTTSPATYNVPGFAPDFVNSKASNPFFTNVNYVGAFARTGINDNWMNGWCNFDPLNTDYDVTCYTVDPTVGVNDVYSNMGSIKVYPNPAQSQATVSLDIKASSSVKIVILDRTGAVVKEVFNGTSATGTQSYQFSTTDMANGMYVISALVNGKQSITKLSVMN